MRSRTFHDEQSLRGPGSPPYSLHAHWLFPFFLFCTRHSDVVFSQSGSVLLLCLTMLTPVSYLGHLIPLDRDPLDQTLNCVTCETPSDPFSVLSERSPKFMNRLKFCYSHKTNKKQAHFSPLHCLNLPCIFMT